MRTRPVMPATTWVTSAAVATAGVTVALSVLGAELLGNSTPIMTEAQVRAELAKPAPLVPSRPAGTQPTRLATAGTAKNFADGTVFAVCAQGQAMLTDWIPAQGYQTVSAVPGPAPAAWVRFASATAALTVSVTCHDGRPRFRGDEAAAGSLSPAARPGARDAPGPSAGPGGGTGDRDDGGHGGGHGRSSGSGSSGGPGLSGSGSGSSGSGSSGSGSSGSGSSGSGRHGGDG